MFFISEKCTRTPRRGPRLSSWVTRCIRKAFYKLKVPTIDALKQLRFICLQHIVMLHIVQEDRKEGMQMLKVN